MRFGVGIERQRWVKGFGIAKSANGLLQLSGSRQLLRLSNQCLGRQPVRFTVGSSVNVGSRILASPKARWPAPIARLSQVAVPYYAVPMQRLSFADPAIDLGLYLGRVSGLVSRLPANRRFVDAVLYR
jgi:hypothetical protein